MTDEEKLLRLERKLRTTHEVLGMLISWMVQSAVSPINANDAALLLRRLNEQDGK